MEILRQIEELIVWLKAIDLLIEQNSKSLFPKANIAISMLDDVKQKIDMTALRNTKISMVIWSIVLVTVNLMYYSFLSQFVANFSMRRMLAI
jgi:hypothetical protein